MKKLYTLLLLAIVSINANAQTPGNDSSYFAIPITYPCAPILGDVAGATVNSLFSSPICSASAVNADVWFTFVAASSPTIVTVTGSSGFTPVIEVFMDSVAQGTSIGCNSAATMGGAVTSAYVVLPGHSYFVRVFDYGPGTPSTTTFTICLSLVNYPPVPLTLQSHDTIHICTFGDTTYINQSFSSVESGQTTNISINLNGFYGVQVLSNTSGYTASAQFMVVGSAFNYGLEIINLWAVDDGVPAATTVFNIPVIVDTNYCLSHPSLVWPGDANNDLIVNNNDLLSVGLYYSQTGTPRIVQGNTWQGDTATNFGIIGVNGADIKHADCNGDGIIDNNDTLAINLNFSSFHAAAPYSNNARTNSPDIYFVTTTNSFNAGDFVDAELWLGNSTTPVSDLYGIAFNINYPASLVQPGTESITYPSSWLGTIGTDAIKMSKIDPLANTGYGAETRTNHTNATGYGKIADFKFQVKTTLTSSAAINLSVSNYRANDAAGASIVLNPLPTVLNVAVGIKENTFDNSISISPNPFTSATTISFSEQQTNTTIKITDVLGKEIKTLPHVQGKQAVIEKGEMKPGIYFLQITDENKNVVNRKIIVE